MQAARQLPDRAWPERVGGLEPQEELLQVVEPVERGHHSGERARRGSVDPADPWPERGLRQPPEEPELEHDAVDPAAREHDCDVASVGIGTRLL